MIFYAPSISSFFLVLMRMKQDTRASVIHLSEDEWTELLKLRGQLRGEMCNAMTDDSTDGEREFGGDDTLNDVLNDEGAV